MTFINIHSHKSTLEADTISVVNVCPQKISQLHLLEYPFSCGIHPWFIHADTWMQQLGEICSASLLPACVAIGESGLDKCCPVDFSVQQRVFKNMVTISESFHKPLIIHCVKAYSELFEMHRSLQPKQTWIIHGFRGKPQLASQLIHKGFYISFGTLFNEQSVAETPIDRLFLETDDKINSIQSVYQQVAEIKKMNISDLTQQIQKNAIKIFSPQLFNYLYKK